MDVVNRFYAGREMLRLQDVADRLGVHRNTVQKWSAHGVIPFHQVPNIGRVYDWLEVKEWYEDAKKVKLAPPVPKTDSEERAEATARFEAIIAASKTALAKAEAALKARAAA